MSRAGFFPTTPLWEVRVNESETDEAALVRQILAGDRDAFERLVSRHHRRVFGIAYRMTGSAADAEDLCQETFLRVFRSLGRYDGRLPFVPWLRKIACNVVLNQLRDRAPERRLTRPAEPQDDEIGAPGAGPEATAASRQRQARIDRAISALPDAQRLAFTLKYVEELSTDEIAETMNAPRNTVKSWLLRAREHLRETLANEL